jgi:YebC/PmpR family DNA-binding regulatory protein
VKLKRIGDYLIRKILLSGSCMSGHSKWSTIKRKKAATDAKRGKLFTKLLREVQVAAQQGGGVPESNNRLRAAIAAARSGSVPADNLERAIKRGTGDGDGADYEDITYEAYGPGGVALLIKSLTDNKNRTVAELRHVLSRHGGSLGSANSVGYLFENKGVIRVPKELGDFDKVFELAAELGAEDVTDGEDLWEVYCDPAEFETVRVGLEALGEGVESSFEPIPATQIEVSGEAAESLLKLLDQLEDLDDVQTVFGNFDLV